MVSSILWDIFFFSTSKKPQNFLAWLGLVLSKAKNNQNRECNLYWKIASLQINVGFAFGYPVYVTFWLGLPLC